MWSICSPENNSSMQHAHSEHVSSNSTYLTRHQDHQHNFHHLFHVKNDHECAEKPCSTALQSHRAVWQESQLSVDVTKTKTHINLKLNTFIRFRLKYDAYFIKFPSLSPQILLLWLIEVDIKTWQQQRRLIWQMGTIHPQTHTPADTQTCTPIHVRAMT